MRRAVMLNLIAETLVNNGIDLSDFDGLSQELLDQIEDAGMLPPETDVKDYKKNIWEDET